MNNYLKNNLHNIGILANRMRKQAEIRGVPTFGSRLQLARDLFPDVKFLTKGEFDIIYGGHKDLDGLSDDAKRKKLNEWYADYCQKFLNTAMKAQDRERNRTPVSLVYDEKTDRPFKTDTNAWNLYATNEAEYGELPAGWRIVNRPLPGHKGVVRAIVNENGEIMGKAANDPDHTIRLTDKGLRVINPSLGSTRDEFGYDDMAYETSDGKPVVRSYDVYKVPREKVIEFLKGQPSRMIGREKTHSLYDDFEDSRKSKEKAVNRAIRQIEKRINGSLFKSPIAPGTPEYRELIERRKQLQSELERDPYSNVVIDMENFKRSRNNGTKDTANGVIGYGNKQGTRLQSSFGFGDQLDGLDTFINELVPNPESSRHSQPTEMEKWQSGRRRFDETVGRMVRDQELAAKAVWDADTKAERDLVESRLAPDVRTTATPDFASDILPVK